MSEKLPEPAEADEAGEQPPSKSYEQIIARWTVILGFATVLLFVATGISAYFLYVTDHTLRDTLNVTTRAAKATEESVKIAGDTAKRQLRAYLAITDVKIDCTNCIKQSGKLNPPKKGLADFRVLVTVKNFGSTPAYEARTCSHTYMAEPGKFPPDDFDYSCENVCTTCPANTLSPGNSRILMLPIETGDVLMASAGFKRLFYYGTTTFKDAFRDSRKLPFCWFIEGGDEGIDCPAHNTAQDD